ncbi:MAG: hypothetical protein AB7O98_00625 [Hyphomonadaceae bacterium]
MSLNKTLDRFFDEIRREAKRNPDFADRLDAVLQRHDSRRDVSDDVKNEVASEEAPSSTGQVGAKQPETTAPPKRRAAQAQAATPTAMPQAGERPALNPAGLYKKGGEEALTTALASQDLGALRALVAEHNLDPGGVTSALTRDELAAHIVAQAKRRAERDEKMFDY